MQVQRLAHRAEACGEPQQHKHAHRGPEWPPSRRGELVRATHAEHPGRIATAARPQSAARPNPLERHPPPPRSSLHLTRHGGGDRKVSTAARRSAGEIDEDARSSGGRPSPPRVRPDTTAGRMAASSGKRGHAPAPGDHSAGPKNWLPTLGALPNVEFAQFLLSNTNSPFLFFYDLS